MHGQKSAPVNDYNNSGRCDWLTICVTAGLNPVDEAAPARLRSRRGCYRLAARFGPGHPLAGDARSDRRFPAAVAAERAGVPREGVGAEILACQGPDGSWHRDGDPDWLPTLFTMRLLRFDRRGPRRILPSPRRWHASRRVPVGRGVRQASRSSRERWSHASTGARSRLAPTSGARLRAWPAVWSASSSMTAVGTAKRRRARARPSIPRSACWRGCSSTSARLGPRRRSWRSRGGQTARRGVPARARSVPAALDRRGRESGVPEFAFPPRYHYDVLRALDYFRAAGVRPTRASAMPCRSSRAGGRATVDGSSITRTTRRSPSRSMSR